MVVCGELTQEVKGKEEKGWYTIWMQNSKEQQMWQNVGYVMVFILV